MIRYYRALVNHHAGKGHDATKDIIGCIVANPLMAEFWCLLGDIYCRDRPDKAAEFYENGMILGEKRPKFDLWPMEISKYKKYPQEMMSKIGHPTH